MQHTEMNMVQVEKQFLVLWALFLYHIYHTI